VHSAKTETASRFRERRHDNDECERECGKNCFHRYCSCCTERGGEPPLSLSIRAGNDEQIDLDISRSAGRTERQMYGWRNVVWDGDDLRLGTAKGRKLLRIVPDQKYPQMWRVEQPNGSLTDLANRTRAKDAGIAIALAILNDRETARDRAPVQKPAAA
jgi:hypothetical protein